MELLVEPLSLQFFLMFFPKIYMVTFCTRNIYWERTTDFNPFFFMIFEDKLYFIISPGIALEIPSIIVFGALTNPSVKKLFRYL